jgi:hypothetical protein
MHISTYIFHFFANDNFLKQVFEYVQSNLPRYHAPKTIQISFLK